VDAVDLGWRNDLRDAYKGATVLVRFTPHDGLSLMVLEALSYGRHVIWTQPFPFVRQVHQYADVEREIVDLLQAYERGELLPNAAASEDIRRRYSPQACIRRLAQAWDDAEHPIQIQQLAPEVP
jgi:glycosyltransferase involved in cell wall biosynthesis